MKNSFLLFIFSLVAGCFAVAGTNPNAEQALATAEKQVDLRAVGASSFRLEIDFLAQNNVPMKGHLTLRWAAVDRWWESITMGDFREIDIRNGEKLYISRNLVGYTPTRVKDLESLMQISQDAASLQIKKAKQRTEHGISLTCLQVDSKEWKTKSELCIDPSSNELLSTDWKESPDKSMREEYGDYREFSGHRYPTKLVRYADGSKVVNATVTDLKAEPLDAALLVPPAGAIERRQCQNMKHAIPVHTPDPAYPPSARENRLMGETRVAITVLTDGSVDNIQLVGRSASSMDEATLNTVKSWKFKPAMCGSEPVVSDIEVEMDFRLTQ